MTRPSPRAILRNGLRVLVPVSVLLTAYLYLFPVFSTCAFPLPPATIDEKADTARAAFAETAKLHWPSSKANATENSTPVRRPLAPFRLLALGDPQLEGDTSIPTTYLGVFPHVKDIVRHVTFQSSHQSLRHRVRQTLHDAIDVFLVDAFDALESVRKRIDHFGNDFYLAHIYRTVRWWTLPTHVTVLGDLLGSQWVDEDEFFRRSNRFWSRVFRGGLRVPDDVAAYPADEYDLAGYLSNNGTPTNGSSIWTRRIINVAGNHDIGYAGDINLERTQRFERAFGKVNYELRFELPLSDDDLAATVYDEHKNPSSTRLVPELRLVVLNDMNLDTPVASPELQDETYAFINKVIHTAAAVEYKGHFTVILTHVPLFKPAGICVDSPLFEFHDHDGTLREQNQLSLPASKGFLEGILGMSGDSSAPGHGRGRRGVILNGHDHEGCDTWHYINQSAPAVDDDGVERSSWEVKRWRQATREGLVGRDDAPGTREITVRSMMGDFGGNAGLLSLWFDEEAWEWRMEYATCPLGTQHLWWLVHILDLIVVVGVALSVLGAVLTAAGMDIDGAALRVVDKTAALLCGPKPKAHGAPSVTVKEVEEDLTQRKIKARTPS